MLFYATFIIVKEAINKLLGEEPTEELINNIKQIVNDVIKMMLTPITSYSQLHFASRTYFPYKAKS